MKKEHQSTGGSVNKNPNEFGGKSVAKRSAAKGNPGVNSGTSASSYSRSKQGK